MWGINSGMINGRAAGATLPSGFMIHRNTMIATADTLFLADDVSCKLIDTRTGDYVERVRS